jgi:hypothetical protein
MGGRTFRSRWVVRWGMLFGGLCTAAALLLLFAAYQKSQERDVAAEEAQARNAKTCEEQIANGTGGDDSPCELKLGGSANESAKGLLSGTVLLAVGLTQLIGAARIGVTLTGSGIIVRNPLRTYRLRWSELKGFRTEVGYRGPMSYAFGRVDLLNGDTHRIEAICAMPWESKETFLDKRVIEALNDELEAHRDDDANALAAHEGRVATDAVDADADAHADEVAAFALASDAADAAERERADTARAEIARAEAERALAHRAEAARADAERAEATRAAAEAEAQAEAERDAEEAQQPSAAAFAAAVAADDDDTADLFDIGDPFDGVNDTTRPSPIA